MGGLQQPKVVPGLGESVSEGKGGGERVGKGGISFDQGEGRRAKLVHMKKVESRKMK
jgi:hypothetical protein